MTEYDANIGDTTKWNITEYFIFHLFEFRAQTDECYLNPLYFVLLCW